ncbi:MAG TPA: response regulator, partial [bacterium]|nr:response regulator [bacterium]
GYEVREAANGAEALEAAADFRPDIIVTDIVMPVMDGWEFIERLRRDEEFARAPVIVISGKCASKEDFKDKRPDNCEFLSKPFDLERLMKISQRMLPTSNYSRSGARPANAV